MTRIMNKPKQEQKTEMIEPALPQPKRYVPPECSACAMLRAANEETRDKHYARVVTIMRMGNLITRYCKCGFCGNTYKDLERVP